MRGLRTAECGVWFGPAVMLAVALALSVVAIPWPADAQQPGKTYRIGWLAPARVPSDLDAFRDGLRGLGYVEGKNVVIEQRYPDRQGEPLAGLAAELTQANVDIFVTTGRLATSAAKSLATATPVVFITGDPVERGYAASLVRPGGTMTGLAMMDLDLTGKRMELLKERSRGCPVSPCWFKFPPLRPARHRERRQPDRWACNSCGWTCASPMTSNERSPARSGSVSTP